MIAHAVRGGCPALIVVALLGTAASLAGCKRLPPPPSPTSETTMKVTSTEPSKQSDQLPAVDLYVDDSGSMQGFVGAQSSEYRRVVATLFEQLITTGYRYSAIRLKELQNPSLKPVTSGEMLTEGFYDAKTTPLAALFAKVDERTDEQKNQGKDIPKGGRRDERTEGGRNVERLVVVISDLVQSEKVHAQQDFLGAFRQLAATRPNVVLVGFRSAFRGRYWVETEPKPVNAYDLDFDGESGECSRPFYLLVFAPSRRSMDEFKKYVLDHVGTRAEPPPAAKADPVVAQPESAGAGVQCESRADRRRHAGPSARATVKSPTASAESPRGERKTFVATAQFRATEPAVGVMDMSFVAQGSFGTYQARESLGSGAGGHLWTLVERRAPDRNVADLRLRVTGTSTLPMQSLHNLQYEVARRGAKPDQWLPASVAISVDGGVPSAALAGDGAPRSFVLLYQFPRPERYTWDVYRVRVRAGRANVVPPAWVESWSTRNDGERSQGHRTLNLHLLVSAMIRGITEEVVLTEHYIRLGRE